MKTVLLTGGTGYIGSHTAVALIEAGFKTVIVDDLSNSSDSVLDKISQITGHTPDFHQIDLRDVDALEKVFQQYQFAAIIHFAAKKAVGESVAKPILYYDVNINSTLNLLKLMTQYGTKKLVFSSSCTVYGQPEKLPVTETTPFQPAESPYGNTKQICEEILRDTCKVMPDIQVISLRYFNPVGAHASSLIGELPLGVPQNLLPYLIQTAAGIRPSLNVYGGDYPTPDGTAIRDYIHVVDLAAAHLAAMNYLLADKGSHNYDVFNLGTGKGSSVLDVIKAFEKNTGVQLKYQIVDRRPGDITQIYGDASKAAKILGWQTKLGLDEMVSSAWKWQQTLMK